MVETISGGENMKKEKYVPEIFLRLRKRSVQSYQEQPQEQSH